MEEERQVPRRERQVPGIAVMVFECSGVQPGGQCCGKSEDGEFGVG